MFRNPSVVVDRMGDGVRVLKVVDAPNVSYWELTDLARTVMATAPNTIGAIAFETDHSGPGFLFPVTLRGAVYRNGIALGGSA
jgi:hypothetical protein